MDRPVPGLVTFLSAALAVCLADCARGAPPAPAGTSRYEVGDYVAYRFSGSFRESPVLLSEEVIAKDGDHLTFLVRWTSGAQRRAWMQSVTDTPENERDNRVDRLVEILSSGEAVPLANAGNADLLRLYAGTYLRPDAPPHDVRQEAVVVTVCGRKVRAQRTRGRQAVAGKDYEFEEDVSPDFLWTRVGARYGQGEDLLYRADVVRCSR